MKLINQKIISTIALITAAFAARAELVFEGTAVEPIVIAPDANTGLEAIYVIEDTQGVKATYTASSPGASIEWTRFSSLGGAYGEPVSFDRDGAQCTIVLTSDDTGYIITENGRQHCYWIVNYSLHEMTLSSASVNAGESDCLMTAIDIDGSAPRISYYTINGVPRELSRDITVSYYNLQWDEGNSIYASAETTETLSSLGSSVHVQAPLCDTDFKIDGDRFLTAWCRPVAVTTPTYSAVSIDAHTRAVAETRDNDNEITSDGSDLGGSAPAEITFSATVTDAVAYREWQMSRFPEFDPVDLQFNQDEVTYTFREAGTTYVRFLAANAAGDCDWSSEVYQVSIGESKIECPNAFSPGASEGINDEWKVSYKSIISFECHIFNSWGIELFSTTDPSQGWDGKHGGKIVPAGVYYYVIKARGADGKDYSLAGDINIINYRQGTKSPSPEQ